MVLSFLLPALCEDVVPGFYPAPLCPCVVDRREFGYDIGIVIYQIVEFRSVGFNIV